MAAAKTPGRRFVGSEHSPDYAAATRRRLDEAHPGHVPSDDGESQAFRRP